MMYNRCQENIRHLIPKPETPVIKPPMYRSIYTESVKKTYKSNKGCHRTMGYAEVQLDPPTQFLKKHTRKMLRPFVGKVDTVRYGAYAFRRESSVERVDSFHVVYIICTYYMKNILKI